jgi:hypothetical protein
MLPSSHTDEDDEILALVDQWIGRFESDSDEPFQDPEAMTKRVQSPAHYAAPASLEAMRSDWKKIGRRTKELRSDSETPSHAPRVKADKLPVKATGLFLTFTDDLGGSISLLQSDGRLQHRGTVGVRSPGMSLDATLQDIGLPREVAQAFEFIAAWYGFPFDSVNARSSTDSVISWGLCDFGGDDLVRCLHEWKRQAPDRFDSFCTKFGIDATDGNRESAAAGEPRPLLTVRLDNRSVQGRAAEWAIATEPRLLAALARAGRDGTAQRVQIEMAIALWVTPVMFQPWDPQTDGERLTLDVLKSPRSIAALVYLTRRHGVRAATRIGRAVSQRWQPHDGEDAWLSGLVRSLGHVNREHDASEVLRICSSPEFAASDRTK